MPHARGKGLKREVPVINSFSKWHVAGTVVFLFFLVAGCSGRPDIVNTKTSPDKTYSDAQVRQMSVDQPFWVSGDYFRKRQSSAAATQKNAAAEGKLKSEATISEQPASARAPTAAGSPAAGTAALDAATAAGPANRPIRHGLKIKVGMLVDRSAVGPWDEKQLVESMLSLAPAFAVLPVLPGQIAESLDTSGCIAKNDLSCAAPIINVFPGVRMLAVVREFSLPTSLPATAHAQVAVMDTGLPVQYPPMQIRMAVKEKKAADSFSNLVIRTIFEMALDKSRMMPWFCRTFASKNKTWFINAGRRSGLKVGDTLTILSQGELVRTPTGLPAGWIPGDPKGTLKIVKLFGGDLAACRLLNGQEPSTEDLLVK